MIVYLIIIFIWIISNFVIKKITNNNNKQRAILTIFIGFTLIIIMGIRDYTVGKDLVTYHQQFNMQIKREDEFVFSYIQNFVYRLNFSFSMFLFINAFIIILPLSIVYYKTSEDIAFSFVIHLTFGMFIMSLTGLRQTMSVGFGLLFYLMIKQKKNIFALMFLVLAYFSHNSSIVSLVYFIFNKIRLKKKTALFLSIVLLSLSLLTLFDPIILNFFIPEKYINNVGVYNYTNPLLYLIGFSIIVFSLIYWPEHKNDYGCNSYSFLFLSSLIYLVILILASRIVLLERLIYYFIPFIAILIPNTISNIKNQTDKKIIKSLLYLSFILYFIISVPGNSLGGDKYFVNEKFKLFTSYVVEIGGFK